METGKFYYLTDEYYQRFAKCGLMGNKEPDETGKHGRPCFYCFQSEEFYWLIPISSKVDKLKIVITDLDYILKELKNDDN